MKINKILYQTGEKIIYGISFLFLAILAACNVFVFSTVAYNGTEKVSFERNTLFYVILAVVLMALFLLLNSRRKFDIAEKKLFFMFSVLYIIAGMYLLFNMDDILRADAQILHDAANSAALKDFSFLEPGKNLYCHPYQLGMVTYERILGFFSKNPKFIFFMNLMEILGINYFTWKLSDLLFGQKHEINLLTIFMSFCFLPQFFFQTFAYGLIPGFFCITMAFYFQQKYFLTGGKKELVLCILTAACSTVLKGNFMIGVIAIGIVFLLHMLKHQKYQPLAAVICMLVLVSLSSKAVVWFYELESGIALGDGTPNITFIAMGTDPDNQMMAPGWHNGYDEWAFNEAGFDTEKTKEMALELLKSNLSYFSGNPKEAAVYFGKKFASVWCDPMFQSVWSGPLRTCGQNVHTLPLMSLYDGGIAEKTVSGLMKSYLLILLSLAVAYMADRKSRKEKADYALLYLIGGVLVHLFWEGKSQYVYPYIFTLIPVCAYELAQISERLKHLLNRN